MGLLQNQRAVQGGQSRALGVSSKNTEGAENLSEGHGGMRDLPNEGYLFHDQNE